MKQAISGTWVYITVLIFMVILIAYVTISINYSASYEISQEVIRAVQDYEGFNAKSKNAIQKVISGNNHVAKGGCPQAKKGQDAIYGVNGTTVDKSGKKGPYDYCITRTSKVTDGVTKYYYETTIFFSFNLPVLGDLFTFKIPGETSGMRNVTDETGLWDTKQTNV